MNKILIIDDEENNILLLKLELEDVGYDIISASDGVEGWKALEEHTNSVKLILLDRMMPNMDGMEFMAKIKQSDQFRKIPVIMQTAAAEKEQVVEGIRAGVYYYLTKPYEEEILISIINAALQDYADQSTLRDQVRQQKICFGLTTHVEWEFSSLIECQKMSTYVATYFPEPERVVMGISEIFINAIEHGNLGITYEEKSELNAQGKWHQEVERRLSLPENADKKVKVTYDKTDDHVELKVADNGNGFEWQKYLEISPDRATDSHGRGIALSNIMSFDELEYIGCGNEVICRINLR